MADDNDPADTAATETADKQVESAETTEVEETQTDQNNNDDIDTKIPTETTDQPALETDVQGLFDVDVEITAVLGTAQMQISQILKLGRGAVVELDRLVGEDIEINANNRLIAKGEVIVIEDRLGVTITNTIKMVE